MYGMWVYCVVTFASFVGLRISWDVTIRASTLNFAQIMAALLVLGVTALRLRAMRWSKKLLWQDQIHYNNIWKSLYESEDGKTCIEHLEKVVRMIGLDAPKDCKQHLRLRADELAPSLQQKYLSQVSGNRAIYPLFWDLQHWYIASRPDPKRAFTSIDQLYAGSAISHLLLLDKVKEWADRTAGMVELSAAMHRDQQPKFVRWSHIKEDLMMRERVRWTSMKRHKRAMEKLVRSYGNAPSLLLDVTRFCLVFEDMSSLTNCLGIIVTDENVRVERVKNRMSPAYDSSETGGYRDVCVNLRMTGQQAMCLGAELVICEVQLLMLDFARLKTAAGHLRYVQVRNSRGT